MSSRTIVIGDVHGYLHELKALLHRFGHTKGDRVYFVGDLIDRGSDVLDTLEFVRSIGGQSVLGNHEEAFVEWVDGGFQRVKSGYEESETSTIRELRRQGNGWRKAACGVADEIRTWPLWIKLDDSYIVHAGVNLEDGPIERQVPGALLHTRRTYSHDQHGGPLAKPTKWWDLYSGPRLYVGHVPTYQPRRRGEVIALDGGIIQGGVLRGYCLEEDRFEEVAAI